MKTTFRFIIAAMAAISVFSSCRKELADGTANNTTDGVRVITAQFDNSTKAAFDGFTPKFANGDKIRVSNAEKSEECTISVSGGTATFTTTLSGALTAVYPADAAVFTGNEPVSSPYFKVSKTQDGTMRKAIIAKAEIAEDVSAATFRNQTAVFEITPPSEAASITIKSLKQVGTDGQRSGTAVAINTDGTDDAAKCEITVSVSGGEAYVALVPGVKLTDLSFGYTVTAATYDGALKGITNEAIATAGKNNATAANTKYTIDNQKWHPYVSIGGKKWATMNIGASSETEAGEYFAWGETTGHVCSRNTAGFTFTHNFDWSTAPFNNGNASYDSTYFASVKDTECPNGILALKNDAANANWGGSWRMPTYREILEVQSIRRDDLAVPSYFGTDDAQIFLPAAGYGKGTGLTNNDLEGDYWSSTLDTFEPNKACLLYYLFLYTQAPSIDRYYGLLVRAVSD